MQITLLAPPLLARPLGANRGSDQTGRGGAGASDQLRPPDVRACYHTKLDRLSHNVAFLLTLRDSGVRFSAVDLPEANDLTVGHHGAGGAAGAGGDLEADQGGAERGQEPRGEAGQPQRRGGAQAGWQGRCAAARGHRAQRRSACAGPGAGGRGHPRRRRDEPAGDRGGAERPRHAHPPRRALARLDGDEPARPARAREAACASPG